ncbi:carbohydrate ABC transporter permease [Streptomyces sp. B6B3]|jgi:putative aldouronate transport system permease protein|uniref:carbohydrate ABC transporter permease n=1 Tax=Streptomyces sp. B6B3 TaxID=3153570 RepID=UPI00325EAC79
MTAEARARKTPRSSYRVAPERRVQPRRRRRRENRPVWEEAPSPLGAALKAAALVGIILAVAFPLYAVVLTSFSTQAETIRSGGLVVIPGELSAQAYIQILSGGVVTRAALVSVGITVVGTTISTVVSAMAAYGLSKPNSFGHRPILFVFIITMFFSAGIVPTYMVVSELGLINSYWALILPSAISTFNVLILRNFFMGIDKGIIEAARIDGASEWRILRRIVVPMSGAVLAVVALFYGVGYFNAFFNAVLYINDNAKWPLQLVLRSYVLQGATLPGSSGGAGNQAAGQVAGLPVKMAIVVLAIVPIMAVYPFVQRHFTKGVIFGAIKG